MTCIFPISLKETSSFFLKPTNEKYMNTFIIPLHKIPVDFIHYTQCSYSTINET